VIARWALRKIFEHVGARSQETALCIEFSDGSICQTYPSEKRSEVLIRFKTSRAQWYSLLFIYEGLFESFVSGDVDLEGEQPIATLARLGHSAGLTSGKSWFRLLRNPLNELRQRAQESWQDGSGRAQDVRNADFHYSLNPALFEAMLGETVGYSEGLWTLNQAKFNNYEYVCRKLRLEPGMTVLEVGAGWGYMPIYMTKRYGVDVTVYNPVRRQNDYMRERFHRHGLGDKIRLVKGDHRDIVRESGRFDRFVRVHLFSSKFGTDDHAGRINPLL